jgi:hypothetical protein
MDSEIVEVEGYNYHLDASILEAMVFELVESVLIDRSRRSLQTDLFQPLKFIRYVKVYMEDLGNFFHGIGIEWTVHFV